MSTKKVALPAGFKAIGGLGQSWKPAKPGDTLQGVLKAVKKVNLPKKGKIPARTVPVYTIGTKDGDIQVWESAGLRALGTVKKGKTVAVVFLGKKKIPGQAQPMRDFAVGVK